MTGITRLQVRADLRKRVRDEEQRQVVYESVTTLMYVAVVMLAVSLVSLIVSNL